MGLRPHLVACKAGFPDLTLVHVVNNVEGCHGGCTMTLVICCWVGLGLFQVGTERHSYLD